jgi:hypothetical protein
MPPGTTKQSRKASLFESVLNCVIGIGIAIVGQEIVFPLYGIRVSLWTSGEIALIFTGISMLRSYALRRFFEWARISGWMP